MRDCCTRGMLHLVEGLYLSNGSIFSAQVLYQKATSHFLSQKTQMSDFSLNLLQVLFCSDQVRFKQKFNTKTSQQHINCRGLCWLRPDPELFLPLGGALD